MSDGQTIEVDGTLFTFPQDWIVEKYDEWPQVQLADSSLGLKACDLVAFSPDKVLWLMEMKDYTYPGARQPTDLDKTVGRKAAGTLALLFSMSRESTSSDAHEFSRTACRAKKVRLVLHIQPSEMRQKGKVLSPALASLKARLNQVAKALHLHGSDLDFTRAAEDRPFDWYSERDPETRARHLGR